MSDNFTEDETPGPGVPYAGLAEFIENEVPAEGVPYLEMAEHYGAECWRHYARRAATALGAEGLARLFRKPHAANIAGRNELVEEESPNPGMPDLCGEYDLPFLEIEG